MYENLAEHSASPFRSQADIPIPHISRETWDKLAQQLSEVDALHPLQLIEGCGYGFAMVVRFALGLSAHGGLVTVIASNTFNGRVALACTRHLLNAGSAVRLFLPEDTPFHSDELVPLLRPLERRGAEIVRWSDISLCDTLKAAVESSHNVLFGISDDSRLSVPGLSGFITFLNESATPIHAVRSSILPALSEKPIYASSTLSIGLPLTELTTNTDIIGRHYLADLSISPETYRTLGYTGDPLFAEQPIIRLI